MTEPQQDQDDAASLAEQMARKLVQDVAAYEVDPPPPARIGQVSPTVDPPSARE